MSKRAESEDKKATLRGVHPSEIVTFYRSSGYYSALADSWHLQVRGSIFSAAPPSIRKGILLQLFKRVIKPENAVEVRQRFNDRARLFLQDGRKGKSVPIAIAEKAFQLSTTLPNGQFETTITVPAKELESSILTDELGRRYVQFCTRLPEDDQRLFTGEIELISPEGISVVSDVDDTIKVSNVRNRKELLANTFTREFRGIEGMCDLYRNWARAGVSFHYVSASPWPLYNPLVEWLDSDRFPAGTMHLRHVRLRDLRGDRTRQAAFQSKKMAIENLLRLYPGRRFILCGDSGERDAELYGDIARDFGAQIHHVAIRNCGHDASSPNLVENRLAHLDRDKWSIFESPPEIGQLFSNQVEVA